jgi:hypothetical protein
LVALVQACSTPTCESQGWLTDGSDCVIPGAPPDAGMMTETAMSTDEGERREPADSGVPGQRPNGRDSAGAAGSRRSSEGGPVGGAGSGSGRSAAGTAGMGGASSGTHTEAGNRAAGGSADPASAGGSGGASGPVCGDGKREAKELCDGDCSTQCAPLSACMPQMLQGSAATCDAHCESQAMITQCVSGDGCCPGACAHESDSDCSPKCGDKTLDQGEKCEDGSSKPCPAVSADCDDDDSCTADSVTGSAKQCSAECLHAPLKAALGGNDGCCPRGATQATDSDCEEKCGDGVVSGNEVCDPAASGATCPSDNDCFMRSPDKCHVWGVVGSGCGATCAETKVITQTTKSSADGCCPDGGNANNDSDCKPRCGNGAKETGETCDGDCPSSCDDGDACTSDESTGSRETCDFTCSKHTAKPAELSAKDGCCPAGADARTDSDCTSTIFHAGETACQGLNGNGGNPNVAQCIGAKNESFGEAGYTDDLQTFHYVVRAYMCRDSSPRCDITTGRGSGGVIYVPGSGPKSGSIMLEKGALPQVSIACTCQ